MQFGSKPSQSLLTLLENLLTYLIIFIVFSIPLKNLIYSKVFTYLSHEKNNVKLVPSPQFGSSGHLGIFFDLESNFAAPKNVPLVSSVGVDSVYELVKSYQICWVMSNNGG